MRISASDGFVKELTIAGFARDSITNPAITSSKRLAVAPQDLEEVRAHTGEVEQLIEFWLHDPETQSARFQKDYLDSEMPQGGQMVDSATFQILTMIGDGMVTDQDITNGGRTAKSVLPTGADPVMWYVVGVELTPGADATATAADYGDRFAPAKVAAIEQWRAQTLGPIGDQITVTAGVSALVAIALAALMTALFTRMLVARDTGQLAIQRAIGADDGGLRQQCSG